MGLDDEKVKLVLEKSKQDVRDGKRPQERGSLVSFDTVFYLTMAGLLCYFLHKVTASRSRKPQPQLQPQPQP
jgi:hypothetical protein